MENNNNESFNEEENNEGAQENKILKILFENFSEIQRERYENWQTSKFSTGRIKKIVTSFLSNVSLNDSTLQILASVCKVFVGELVEEARTIMTENGENGQIQPWHIREAYRRLDQNGKNLQYNPLKRIFDI